MQGSMKGVILAGGLGSRLRPLTKVTNKHLLPIYDKPMIYYPIETLVRAGIKDIMIVTGGSSAGDFLRLLGNGSEFGLKDIYYTYQEGEGGIADALKLCEHFAEGERVAVILGDNIVQDDISPFVRKFDLNVDRVPDDLRGRFDLVLNFGTSEHVMNQYNVFEVIHDLMKPGGLTYSMFLINGFGPHGLLRYSSQFVDALASTNEYEVVFRETHRGPPGSIDECEWIVFRKGGSASFRPALDNIG